MDMDMGNAIGLATDEANARLAQFGRNEPAESRTHSVFADIWRVLANPLVLILTIAAVASAFLGEVVDAAIIFIIVGVSAAIDLAQTRRSQGAITRLRDRVAPTATVRRDGDWKEIDRRQVVPGDIIRLSAGDLIPADARLLTARDLFVQQAALTGESLPVEKQPTDAAASTRADTPNMVFFGTSVVSGTATAEVLQTGSRTSFGDIAARLGEAPEETAFDRGLHGFSRMLAATVLTLVVFLLAVSVARHRDPLQSLLFAVALAVGLTPEFLPMITTVTLSRGAVVMARKKVIVKHLSAIENLGSVDILCSDKTGTLTSGTLSLDRSLDPFGNASDHTVELAFLASYFETGVRSPLDQAILHGQGRSAVVSDWQKLDEVPFDFERRRMSVVVERAGERTLIVKGAPEGILPLASSYETAGAVLPAGADAVQRARQTNDDLSRSGFRCLAVAFSRVPVKDRYTRDDERNLTLAGFVTFADAPLPDAAETVMSLRNDGIEMKVISGDNDLVTAHVCAAVGLATDRVLRGDDLDRMTDPALGATAEQVQALARISPAQKSRVLLALKHRGHAVAFMGDGINDAPSLHAADVGISVSSRRGRRA